MKNIKFYQKFLFIISLPRSGGHILLSSLSSHSQIIAWPFEFFYFNFFNSVVNSREEVLGQDINPLLINKVKSEINNFFLLSQKSSSNITSIKDFYNNLDFDMEKFELEILKSTNKSFDSMNYLEFIFDCLKKARPSYNEKKVLYYLMFTGVRGLDWTNEELIAESNLIFMHRPLEDWYASLRRKQLKNNINLLNPFGKKSFLYWMETSYRMNNVLLKIPIKKNNFFQLSLYDLQEDSQSRINDLCIFFGMQIEDSVSQMTILGSDYPGHSNHTQLNEGKILPLNNKNNFGMSYFEWQVVTMLGKYKLFSKAKDRSSIYSRPKLFFSIFKHLYLDKTKLRNESTKGTTIQLVIETLLNIIHMTIISLCITNKSMIKIILKRKNYHVDNFSIWKG